MLSRPRKLIAIAVAAAALATALPAASASASTLSGTVLSGNTTTRVAGAAVYAHRYVNGAWSSAFYIATTNSSGNYSAAVTGNYWYYVEASKRYGGGCGPNYILQGNSSSFWVAPYSTASASIRIWTVNSWYVQC